MLKDLYLLYDITTNTPNSTDNSNVDFPEGCIPVITTDHPEDPITHATEQLIAKVRGVSLMPVLFVFGVAGTCTSIASFYKQGLNHRINLCLFSLETVNLINVAFLFLLNVDSLYRTIDDGLYGVVFAHIVNSKMLGMLGFMYGTMYLSALVAWERCLTVLFPLHSKSLLSIRTMAILILLGSVITILPFFFVAAWYEAVCFYDLINKRSTIGVSINEMYFEHKTIISSVEGIYYGIILSLGIPIVVLIATIITGVKLRQTVSFRKQMSSVDGGKETAVTKMLLVLSVVFLVTSIPNIIVRVIPLFEPEVRADGRYKNSFLVLVSGTEVGSIMYSCVNFFIYYFAGTKYRQTVHELYGCSRLKKLFTK